MDANEQALKQHESAESAEERHDDRLRQLVDELTKSEGDFEMALLIALEGGALIKELHEMYAESRRMDFGVELCEKIDDEIIAMANNKMWLESDE